MASRTVSIVTNGLLRRLNLANVSSKTGDIIGPTFSTKANLDPSKFVVGVTAEDLENNPTLAEYFASNVPEYGRKDGEKIQMTDPLGNPLPDPPISRLSRAEAAAKAATDPDADTEGLTAAFPHNIRPLSCYTRDLESEEGTKRCRRLRSDKMIPGILYGSDPTQNIISRDASSKILVKTPLNVIQREMDLFTYHNFQSRVYNLTLYEHEDDEEGITQKVVPQDVQHHPVQNNKLYCCNYLRYFPGRPVKIPILYTNEEESPALKRGGFIVPVNRYISCIIEDGVAIPEAIELDCTGASLKEVLRMDRLVFPDGVEVSRRVKEDTFLVGSVFGRRSDGDGDEEEEK